MTITETLAKFISEYSYERIPESVVHTAKECIIDTLGAALCAISYPDMAGIVHVLLEYDSDTTSAIVWNTKRRGSLQNALLLNGTMGHTTEMDDVHKLAKAHVGAIVVPAALTLGEYLNSKGKDIIRAIVLGYETALRISIGIGATSHRLQGWHATGTCGIFASAVAAAVLLEFDEDKIADTLGLAGTQASGLWAFTTDGASCKKFHAGKACHGGVLAALLAKGGMTGPRYILEAKDGGLYRAASKEYDFDKVTDGLGIVWEILNVDRKPFACCRSMHPSIDAILQLENEVSFSPEEVEVVEVRTYEVGYRQCGLIQTPKNVSEAQFSIPYGVAVALYDKAAGLQQFSETRVKDSRIQAMTKRVRVYSDDRFSKEYPINWGCEVTLKLADGRVLKKHVVNAKGDHSVPLNIEALREKFIALSGKYFSKSEIDSIIYEIQHLESSQGKNIGKLLRRSDSV